VFRQQRPARREVPQYRVARRFQDPGRMRVQSFQTVPQIRLAGRLLGHPNAQPFQAVEGMFLAGGWVDWLRGGLV